MAILPVMYGKGESAREVSMSECHLWGAFYDVNDTKAHDALREASRCQVHPVMCVPEELEHALDRLATVEKRVE
jgi:hypothetical protein